MTRLRLQTQLLISTVVIICALTGAMLLIVRHAVHKEMDQQMRDSVTASVKAFETVQAERQLQLSRIAALLAELPPLKALMTTQDAPTIQDASQPFWNLAGSDLFLLADRGGHVVALHGSAPGISPEDIQRDFTTSFNGDEEASWWSAGPSLYWVFIRPIDAGSENDAKQLGFVAIGYEVDSRVAKQLAVAADSKIALAIDHNISASTLSPTEESELKRLISTNPSFSASGATEITLAGEEYQVAAVSLDNGPSVPVKCYVLVPLRRTVAFIAQLDHTILALGISAVLLASILLSFVSGTITRPLENLVAGVRALGTRDFTYSITPRGSSEIAELGQAFSKMREDLRSSERQRLESERIAALGRAAGSISHDLRHHLATVVANAEFLHEADRLKLDRDEVYCEIRLASEQMTELIDSLRELSSENPVISPVSTSLEDIIHRAVDASLARPEFRDSAVSIRTSGQMLGSFDPKKIQRAFFNLVLNACEATTASERKIAIDVSSTEEWFEVRITDNGAGIPLSIRNTLFDPFVSSGKSNGTGLGLAIVSKIIGDHGGAVTVERSSELGTVFLVRLPRFQSKLDAKDQEYAELG